MVSLNHPLGLFVCWLGWLSPRRTFVDVVFLGASFFLLAYTLLGPRNCLFTFVKEGTVKFVVKGDEFHRCLIQWKGYTFDYQKPHPEKWNIIEGREKHLFGGFRLYSLLWPLYDILVYKFRWVGVTEEGKEQVKTEWLDYMLVKDDVYLCKIPAAEDKDKLPLDLQVFLTIRIVNPYKAKFMVQRWLETVLNRIQPLIRQVVARHSYEELLPIRQQVGGEMWQALEQAGLLGPNGEFYQRYGVEVRAIEVRQIEPPENWRAITLKKYDAQREAEALAERAKGEKQAIITKAEGEATRITQTYGATQQFGQNGFLLRVAEETKGKDVPALVITHHLAAKFEEMLRDKITRESLQKILEELKQFEEIVRKTTEGR